MAFDPASNELVLFGGLNGTLGALNDTWTRVLLVRGWAPVAGAAPPPRWDAAFAYDPALGGVVLFGGLGPGGQPLGDTWLFRGDRWTPIVSLVSPAARSGSSLVWQGDEERMTLFGGNGSAGPLSDTWGLASGGWYPLSPTLTPSPRTLAAVGSDGAGDPVIFGGWGTPGYLNDTWILYGDNWSEPTVETVARPAAAEGAILVPDAGATPNDLLLYWGKGEGGYSIITWGLRVQNGGSPSSPPPLRVAAQASGSNGTSPFAASFEALGSGGVPPYGEVWGFGDGTPPSINPYPRHVFASPGNYLAHLLLQDTASPPATASADLAVHVHAPNGSFAVNVSATERSGPPPLTTTLFATPSGGMGPYSYRWLFGDGTPSSRAPSPTHIYNASGTFVARLFLNDSRGASANFSYTMRVVASGLAVAFTASPSQGHPPITVAFHASAQGGDPPYHYFWSFGDGNSSYGGNANATNLYGRAGTFEIRVTVLDAQGSNATASEAILVTPPPPFVPPPPTLLEKVARLLAPVVRGLSNPWVLGSLVLVIGGTVTLRWGLPTVRLRSSVRRGKSSLNHEATWGVAEVEVVVHGFRHGAQLSDLLGRLRPLVERDARRLASHLTWHPGSAATWLARRALLLVPQLLIAATVLFIGLRALPGLVVGPPTFPGIPFGPLGFLQAWWSYVSELLGGGLSDPYLAANLPYTLQFMGVIVLLSAIISYPLGVLAGWKQGGVVDQSTRFAGVLANSFQIFVVALLTLVGAWLWYYQTTNGDFLVSSLPSILWDDQNMGGIPPWVSVLQATSPTGFPLVDAPLHGAWAFEQVMLLKILVQALPIAGVYSAIFLRYARLATLEAAQAFSNTGGRAKGLAERTLLWRHTARRIQPTYAEIFGATFPVLLSLQVVAEWFYDDQGVGSLFVVQLPCLSSLVNCTPIQEAMTSLTIGRLAFLLLLLTFVANLVGDAVSRALDPVGRVASR